MQKRNLERLRYTGTDGEKYNEIQSTELHVFSIHNTVNIGCGVCDENEN